MANDSLPEIPQKFSWWKAIVTGRAGINRMIEQLTRIQKDAEVKRDEAAGILTEAEAKRDEAAGILADAEAKRDEAARILADAEAKMAEAARILADAEAKRDEVQQAITEAQKEKEAAAKAKEAYIEEKGIKPEIPEGSLERDMIVKKALMLIQGQVEEHGERIAASRDAQKNSADMAIINKEKATLKAALLAVTCAYRDALPEAERAGFIINGKSVSLFLQELAVQIVQDSQTGTNVQYVDNQTIEFKAFQTIDSTYKQVAKSMGCTAGPVYPGAPYGPFSEALAIDDSRGVAKNVFLNCYNGKGVGLELTGGFANFPRTASNKSEQTSLESDIQDTATAVEDWER